MHFFKLFLAATFAVSASLRGLLTLVDVRYGSTLVAQKIWAAGMLVPICAALVSLFAGALIAVRLRRRTVPKAFSAK